MARIAPRQNYSLAKFRQCVKLPVAELVTTLIVPLSPEYLKQLVTFNSPKSPINNLLLLEDTGSIKIGESTSRTNDVLVISSLIYQGKKNGLQV